MTDEQFKMMMEILTEMRDEIFRQGHAVNFNSYGQMTVMTQKDAS